MTEFTTRLHERARLLPEAARTIVDFASDVRASGLLVCDMSARPIGYAVERWMNEAGNPEDIAVMYARVSKRIPEVVVHEQVGLSLQSTSIDAESAETIVVVDDHVGHGITLSLARRALALHLPNVETKFVSLTGKGADLTVYPSIGPGVAAPWKDMPYVIGHGYSEDGSHVVEASTDTSRAFYSVIDDATTEYASSLAVPHFDA